MAKSELTGPDQDIDLQYMTVVCTPEATAVSFHEFLDEDGEGGPAISAAAEALEAPRTSAYVGHILLQGSTGRGTSVVDDQVLVPFHVDPELRVKLGQLGVRGRRATIAYLASLLAQARDAMLEPAAEASHESAH